MCFKCVLRALAAEAAQEQVQAGAPGQTEAPAAAPVVDIDVEHAKAQIVSMNAESVHRLTEAAQSLYELGEGALADRVLLALDTILPKRAERRTTPAAEIPTVDTNSAEQVNMASAVANQPIVEAPVDEFAGAPEQLKAYVLDMRAKGFEVELVNLGTL